MVVSLIVESALDGSEKVQQQMFFIGVAVLIGVVILDVILYPFFGNTTECYRCRRNFPHVPVNPEHEGFDLATAEKYRQRT